MKKFFYSFLVGISFTIFSSNLFSEDMRKIFTYYSQGEAGTYTAGGMKHWQGPSFAARNKLTEPNLVSLELPSLKAGCSGIDFHAGGFSLVTKDEIVQMARGIAQGAPGYFFNLAIGSICSSCLQAINEFMAKLHKFNDLTKDSCNKFWDMASDKFASSKSKQDANSQSKAGLLDNKLGFLTTMGDTLDEFYPDDAPGKSAGGRSNEAAKKAHNDNIIYRRLKDTYDSPSDVPIPGITVNQFELIMSLFGTVIISVTEDKTLGPNFIPKLPSITPEQIVFGTTKPISFYQCTDLVGDPDCFNLIPTDVTGYEGVYVEVLKLLEWEDDSIIKKIARRENLDSDQVNFITAYRLPYLKIAMEAKNFRSADLSSYFALHLSERVVAELFNDLVTTLRIGVVFGEEASIKVDQKEKITELIELGKENLNVMKKRIAEEKNKIAKSYEIYSAIENINRTHR